MTKGLQVTERDVRKYGKKFRLFSGEQGRIVGYLVSYQRVKNTKGKSVKVRETIHEELYRVFPEIRYVFDRHGVKIAERRKPGEPLYSTGRGYFRNIEQKNKKTGEEKKNGKN